MIKWDNNLWLFTPSEFSYLPDGIELKSINGERVIKGKDYIDKDVRFGHLAYGIEDPMSHPEAELFTKMKLLNPGR